MKNLIFSIWVTLFLIGCSMNSDSVIVEIHTDGLFVKGSRIDDLQAYFAKIESLKSRGLVFLVNSEADTVSLKDAIGVSQQFKFKSVSISQL